MVIRRGKKDAEIMREKKLIYQEISSKSIEFSALLIKHCPLRPDIPLMTRAAKIQNNLHQNGEFWRGCSYENEFAKEFSKLLIKYGADVMPSVAALVMAIGGWMDEYNNDDSGFDPLKFSSKRGAGDFVRGFVNTLRKLIDDGHLPNKLTNLSKSSLENITNIFYPFTTIKTSNYINHDWTPKTQ